MSDLTLRSSHLVGGAAVLVVGALLLGRAGWPAASTRAATQEGSNVAVNCEPGQQALVRQTLVKGEPHVAIQCSGAPALTAASGVVDEFGRVMPVNASRLVPAVYAPQAVAPAPVRTRTVAAAPRRVATRAAEPGRSWQKRALVIGSTSGIGAGIGAAIGGKKGALIGAAIGAGGGTLYEVSKK